jgi:HAMP domain-containing protein
VQDSLSELVGRYVEEDAGAAQLRDRVGRHVHQVARRYPDAYFELGRRTPEALEGLADRVFTVCARVPKGRFPFQGREPFQAFVEERFDDPPIRYHSFYARLSITRELLRDDYAFNIRHDPTLRWRDELHRAVGQALKARCEAVDEGPGAWRRWRIPGRHLAAARPLEEVRQRLAAGDPRRPVEALVEEALALAGRPLSHSQVSNLLADALGGPPDELAPEVEEAGVTDRMAVRAAVLSAWEALGDEDRALLAALARGDSYDALIARVPGLRDRSAVSRAVSRCGEGFVARVVQQLGDGDASPSTTPKELVERVVAVLFEILPDFLDREAL